jgi:hypothetical protein
MEIDNKNKDKLDNTERWLEDDHEKKMIARR